VIALLIAGTVAFLTSIVGTPFLISWLRAHASASRSGRTGPRATSPRRARRPWAASPSSSARARVPARPRPWPDDLHEGRDPRRPRHRRCRHRRWRRRLDQGRKARNLGLNKRAKIGGLLVVAIGFGVLAVHWANVSTDLSFTRFDSLGIALPAWVFVAGSCCCSSPPRTG
jgi:hypothetical protein